MTKRRAAGAVAFALELGAAWSVGSAAVQADELADLRANQELLQRRLDQLAQIPAPGGPYPGGARAPSAGAGLVGGSFPRSFLVPGTDTSLRVGGAITEVIDYFFSGGNPNSSPQSTTVGNNGQLLAIPLTNPARARGHSIFWTSPRESRLEIETRTPTAWGEARTYMEFDWAGSTAFAPGGANPTSVSDNLVPRLRFAYGTLGGFLAGQANSNFSDPDANSETIDFGGNVGDPGVVRIPQVRYTMPLRPWGFPGAFSVSAETPETDAVTAFGILGSDASPVALAPAAPPFNPTKAKAPDLTMAWFIPQPWGHMDYSLVVRPGLQVKDGNFVNRSFVGYGLHFGGDVKPGWFEWKTDDITFHFTYGNAIGRYLNSNSNFALVSNYPTAAVTTAAAAANVLIRPTVEWGGNVGYRHSWAPNLRSTVSMGINHHDIDSRVLTPALRGSLNKELVSAHANLIWSPVPFVDVGAEYMWGHRLVVSNLKGDENVLISRFRVRF